MTRIRIKLKSEIVELKLILTKMEKNKKKIMPGQMIKF